MKKIVFLLVIAVVVLRSPGLQAKLNHLYRKQLFNSFQSQVINGEFDSENYWQFRERFSPGSFTADQENIDFFTTFRITQVKEELTPLLFYKSDYLNSVDSLLSGDFSNQVDKLKQDYPGEILVETDQLIFIKTGDSEYLLSFTDSIEKMKMVNGMFDYKSEERELIKDQLWYNVTEMKL